MHGTLTHGKDSHAELHDHASADAVTSALALLHELGERVTAPRRAVLDALAAEHAHATAEQLAAALPDVHRATVYRTVERLAELGIATSMHTGGGTAYHLAVTPTGHEHLHARCRACDRIVVLPADSLQTAVERLGRARLFRLEPDHSELVGLCEDCASTD
ncbi:MAG: transcriptional repressor [Microbacteriaceae bacterium]|nr:transcriptional repressor [Microbacteriaceae bacterium]